MGDFIAQFDLFISSKGDTWREESAELRNAGYTWEWLSHRDGTEVFLLKDIHPFPQSEPPCKCAWCASFAVDHCQLQESRLQESEAHHGTII